MFWSSAGPCVTESFELDEKSRTSLTKSMANAFSQMRANHEFTDLILLSDDGLEFPVHTDLVCSASDYFDRIIRHDAQAITDALPKLSIYGIPGSTLKLVLDYLYSGTLAITLKTVPAIYQAGDFFTIPSITQFCLEWLEASFESQKYCPKSSLILLDLYQKFEYPQLYTTLHNLLYRKPFDCTGNYT